MRKFDKNKRYNKLNNNDLGILYYYWEVPFGDNVNNIDLSYYFDDDIGYSHYGDDDDPTYLEVKNIEHYFELKESYIRTKNIDKILGVETSVYDYFGFKAINF